MGLKFDNAWWRREDTLGLDASHMLGRLPPVMHPMCFQDMIEIGSGCIRRIVPARKDEANPVLAPEKPWEGKGLVYPSVIRERDGRWRMWYPCKAEGRSLTDGTEEGQGIALAESDDGRSWRRPELGRHAFQGSTANNICHLGHGGCVIRDDNAAPAQRYRMFANRHFENTGFIFTLVSPDGMEWTMLRDKQIRIRNDSQNGGFRDPLTGKWVVYHRPGWCTREVARSVSLDDAGLEFMKPYPSLRPDAYDNVQGIEHYAISVHPYDGGYIGMLRIYHKRWDSRLTWIELVCSRDGFNWQRIPDRTPIIGLGPDGAWDSRMIAPSYSLVPEDDGHWFYYDSWNVAHFDNCTGQPNVRCCIGRAFLPRRRLVEWAADLEDSVLRTFPMILQGETLKLDGSGEMRAGIERFDGSPPEGFAKEDSSTLNGDFTEGAIHFKGGSLKQFGAQPVRLYIHMRRGARLYALGVI